MARSGRTISTSKTSKRTKTQVHQSPRSNVGAFSVVAPDSENRGEIGYNFSIGQFQDIFTSRKGAFMATRTLWDQQQEAKLLAWHQMQLKAPAQKAPCITIAREFGCQAYPLAEELLKRLNARQANSPWVIIGKQVLDEVARMSGYSVDQIEKSQDTPASLKAIFSMFLDKSHAEETEIFVHMKNVIRDFARRGNCILVGRGAVFAAQDFDNCVHLRLVAPYDFRVQKIMKGHRLNGADAEKFIEMHQKQRDDFVRRFADGKIDDPHLYHLVFNNSRLPVEKIAEMTESYML